MDREELLALGASEDAADALLREADRIREEYEGRIAALQQESRITELIKASGARNVRAVRGLLESQDAESVERELETLKKGEDTSFLFERGKSFAPSRSGERLPDTGKSSYEVRLGEARKRGDTVEAIRIKQQAASEGIVLI